MKIFRLLPALPIFAIVSSCSGIMPGFGILAPHDVSGYSMDFSDLRGMHHYQFLADGTYREECTPADISKASKKSGNWEWTRKSPSRAILTLDGSETLNLNFTTNEHANGSFGNSGQMYAFEFREQ